MITTLVCDVNGNGVRNLSPRWCAVVPHSLRTNHLGSVVGMTWSGGTYRDGSLARYDPFGNYRTPPGTAVNPDISDRGFTGHRQNNTGANDLGLIYMNARYYLPEVGRFISADTIVPNPQNPQSYNRYSYTLNSPLNYTDPTGHRETSGCDMLDCTRGGTVNPTTYRSADGTYSFADPNLSGRHLSPANTSIAPYGSIIQNVDNAVEGYSGLFAYQSTTVAYKAGVSVSENHVPGDKLGSGLIALVLVQPLDSH